MRSEKDTLHRSAAITGLAEAQYGVVARSQLLAAGVSASAIDRDVANRRLLLLHRGVYAVGHQQLRVEGYWLAAVMAYAPHAVLSHVSAAALWELRFSAASRVHVTAPSTRKRRPGIVLHRVSTLHPDDVTHRRGIPTTTVERTLLDLAGALSPQRLKRAVDQADVQRRLDPDAVMRAIERRPRLAGCGTLKALIAEYHEPMLTRGELEVAFVELCARSRLPEPAVNATVEGFEVDFSWREHRLAIEADSARFHQTAAAFERDRARDVRLVAAGWRAARFTYRQITYDPHGTAALLRRLLAA